MKKLVVCLAVLAAALSCGAQEPAKTGYGSGAPPAIFVPGPIGSIYVDQSTSLVYFCTAITIVNQIPNCTWTQEGGGGAFNTIGPGTNSNAGIFGGSGNTWDFTGATIFKLRVAAGLTTSANGDFGFDSTNNNWHGWNGADLIFAPLAAGFVSGDCGQPTATAGKWVIADTGSACGTGGSGNVSTSGSPLNHQYAIFSPDATHITGVTPGTAGLPLVSNGTAADPSAQQLPAASVVPSANNGDNLCTTSGAAAWCTPGITINSITGTTYTVAAADRSDRDQFTGTAASAWTLPQAGTTGFGNNFFFTVPNFSANNVNVTLTPNATSHCNGGANCIIGQGQVAYVTSNNTDYFAHISWNSLAGGSLVTITPNQFGGTVDLTNAVPISLGGTGQTTQQAGFNALACTPTRAGDVTYYNGTNWVCLAGNNSGTNALTENASGVPSWAAAGGTPSLDQVLDPAANKAFSMGAHSLAFNWGTNAFNLDTAGAAPTFGLASYTAAVTNSPTLCLGGSYENAATPTFAEESACLQLQVAAGLNGNVTLALTDSGSTGTFTVALPASTILTANTFTANSTTGGFTWNGPTSSSFVNNSSGAYTFNPASGQNLNVSLGNAGSFQVTGGNAADNVILAKAGTTNATGNCFQSMNSSAVVAFAINCQSTSQDAIANKYGNETLAGRGLDAVRCVTSQKSETGADAAVLSCTPASAVGSYKIYVVISVSAASAATLGWTATWTDSNGNAQTPTNLALTQSGAAAPALTFTTSAAGNYYAEAPIDINNAGTAIVVKTTFSGTSIAYKISAWVERTI